MKSKASSYKIRQVVELTGVSEFLLRVWEDRYQAFEPSRTDTGRRLYSENDVLKARALLAITQKGLRIGDIAQLNLGNLYRLLQQHSGAHVEPETDPRVKEIVDRANQFKWDEVRALMLKEKIATPPLEWIHTLIVPLLIEMGRQVDAGHFTIASEHILSAIIRENLASPIHRAPPTPGVRPRIVLAAPEGDFHDLGLLIASFISTERGANTLYLGPHMPKNELASVCVRFQATHLLLSSTATKEDGAKDDYLKYLNYLDRNLDPEISLWLAGRNSQKYPISLKRPSQVFSTFQSFESEVKKCLQ